MRYLSLLVLLLPAVAHATSELDYVEHLFGATNVHAVGGHGQLTIGVASDGDLTVLSWPSPGFADQLAYLTSNDLDARSLPHLGAQDGMGSYLGLLVTTDAGTRLVWLRDLPAAQRYSQPDAPVPVTTFTGEELGLTVTLTDVVSADADVPTRHVHVQRAAGSPVSGAQLVVYENLSPTLTRLPQVPVGDWGLDPHADFLAVWDEDTGGILHVHPGDSEVFLSLVDLVNLNGDVAFGAVDDLMKEAAPDVAAFVAGLDESYAPGVAAIVTTEPAPASHQVGADATRMCGQLDVMVDNLLALPDIYPSVNVPLTEDAAAIFRCVDQLPGFADAHGWQQRPEDALADLADGTLSGAPLAAAQTNGALLAPLVFVDNAADGSMVVAFGATRREARAALATVQAQPFAARLAASEGAAHEALAGARLPDPSLGERVHAVALRALVNLYVARDRATGAMLASVTRQPPYALDWPRDGAFLSLAADLAGRGDWVEQRALWYDGLIRTRFDAGNALLQPEVPIDPDSGHAQFPRWAWEMNYYVDGEAGGPVRFEIDNTALHVWSLVEHAARLEGAERAAFVARIWPNCKNALDLLVRWKEADTGLPAPANEDDNAKMTSTLHGAVAVLAALVAGARLAHAAGDDDAALVYLGRADVLRAAIDTYYFDKDLGLFRAARGLPAGPHDAIGGWITGWLVWPARFFVDGEARQEAQLDADLDAVLRVLRGEVAPGGTYLAKNTLSAALYGAPAGSRAKAREALDLLADIADPGVDAFGEVYMAMPGPGGVTWENRTAMPHVWEGVLFYLTAMALSDPSLFNADERLPLPARPAEGGCRAAPGGGAGAGWIALLLLALTTAGRGACGRFRARPRGARRAAARRPSQAA